MILDTQYLRSLCIKCFITYISAKISLYVIKHKYNIKPTTTFLPTHSYSVLLYLYNVYKYMIFTVVLNNLIPTFYYIPVIII